jgi:hypothetical protein
MKYGNKTYWYGALFCVGGLALRRLDGIVGWLSTMLFSCVMLLISERLEARK